MLAKRIESAGVSLELANLSVNNILFKYKVHRDTSYIQYNTFERDTATLENYPQSNALPAEPLSSPVRTCVHTSYI